MEGWATHRHRQSPKATQQESVSGEPMEVGDLVRETLEKGDIGIIIKIGIKHITGRELYKVSFADKDIWLADTVLEVICK